VRREPAKTGSVDVIHAKLKALQDDLNKAFGPNTAQRLDAPGALSKITDSLSTRSIVVDSVLRGGRPVGSSLLPFGRQVEISGPENSGKTTLCAQAAAEAQAQGGLVIVTDTEERIDDDYWAELGVDNSKVLKINAKNVVEVFNRQYKVLKLIKEKFPDDKVVLIWDSLGGTSPTAIVDSKKKDETPMQQAKKANMRSAKDISDGIKIINEMVTDTRVCYMYTNHEYTKIGVTYGDPKETYGGNKPKYYATVRIRLQFIGRVVEEDPSGDTKEIGRRIKVTALKNSMAGVLLTREAVIMAHRGFVNEYTVWELGAKLGAIEKNGSWTTWVTPKKEEVKFQGWEGFLNKVVQHPEYLELVDKVVEAM